MNALPYIRSDIRALPTPKSTPLLGGDFIALNTRQMPFSLPNQWHEELATQLFSIPIHHYSMPDNSELLNTLRRAFELPDSAAIALGNGADELLHYLTLLIAQPNASVLSFAPASKQYLQHAQLLGLHTIELDTDAQGFWSLDETLKTIEKQQPALIVLPYPSPVTGILPAREDVEAIIKATTGLVVIDERYADFSQDSFLTQAGSLENVLVLRSLSKIGLANLRIAYAVSNIEIITELQKILPKHSINPWSATIARFALGLEHLETIKQNIHAVLEQRENLTHELTLLEDVEVLPSQSNFLTIRLPNSDYALAQLHSNKILVNNLNGTHPSLTQCLQLTVGLPEENAQALSVIRAVIEEHLAVKYAPNNLGEFDELNRLMIRGMLLYVAFFMLLSIFMCVNYFSHLA